MRAMPPSSESAAASPSSTVVIARAGAEEPEVFMVRRSEQSSFGMAYAFPGGVLETDDAAIDGYCGEFDDAAASARLGIESGGLAYFSAAIRETFEETGVMFADVAGIDENLQAVRDGLNDGSVSWTDFVSRNTLELQCAGLHYFAHWVTPPQQTRRYSTRFFLAELPAGQEPVHCGGELTESCWTTAQEMLAAKRRGDAVLIYPTIKTLESIARHKSLAELVEWAASCVEWGVTSMIPELIERNGRQVVVLPGDKDYPGHRQ